MKKSFRPGALLSPVPAVLVSCAAGGVKNLFTAAWTGTVCTDPPMLYVSIRPSRYSYRLIKESGEFVVNLVGRPLVKAADLCGVKSGRDCDKAALAGVTYEESTVVSAPSVAESPLSVECRVKEIIPLGTHDMFLAEIAAVTVDESLVEENGRIALDRADLAAYCHGEYFALAEKLGSFGFSVMKPSTKRKKAAAKAKTKGKG